MLHTLNSLVANAAIERLVLVVNHLLEGEPIAALRLRTHAGRFMQLHFENWPAPLPPLPQTTFRVTPAGLIELCTEAPPAVADLSVRVDASNPALALAQAMTGKRPKVDVSGDAAFATDLNWLFDNLRWDMQDDLERVVGPVAARETARVARGVAAGVRMAARAVDKVAAGGRDSSAGPPPR